jgi:hypothetical protein
VNADSPTRIGVPAFSDRMSQAADVIMEVLRKVNALLGEK